ncbi:MAG TPA: Gfo/Idh/MocA family oxidoreductase [Anaerolineales bacterium]|nr:Gfo/Idh/MocA family oxidoreductase [Anaerolineales bacterium]
MTSPLRVALIGTGGMARHHIRQMLTPALAGGARKMQSTTRIVALCEPSEAMARQAAQVFVDADLPPPPNYPDWERLIAECGTELDAAFIITPHALHHDQTRACLEAGIDVLLEKPMVLTAAEARSLIETRDRTGRLLVVAFQGSLSPQVRLASRLLRANEFGRILTISGLVWQDWGPQTANTWRQQPALSGGGFLFDTGAHLLNTVADLAGEDFSEVAAWFVHNGRPVETLAVAIGRLASGGLVTFHACGEAIPSCASEIRVFCEKAILHTGIWGETLAVQYMSDLPPAPIPVLPSRGVWEQFLEVRSGRIPNPSPPEVGLRMAKLWDAIRTSAANNGIPVKCE